MIRPRFSCELQLRFTTVQAFLNLNYRFMGPAPMRKPDLRAATSTLFDPYEWYAPTLNQTESDFEPSRAEPMNRWFRNRSVIFTLTLAYVLRTSMAMATFTATLTQRWDVRQ